MIQLRTCKSILGCSFKACDEHVCVDLGLESLESRRDLHKFNWLYKGSQMPSFRWPASLHSTEWDAVKCRGRLRKSWRRYLEELKSELELQDSVSDHKQIWSALKDKENREFQFALQQKSKLHIYKELKRDFGLEEYLKHVLGAHAKLFFMFR